MSLNVHHKRAAAVITVAAALDVALGAAFGTADHIGIGNGLYFATSVATTSGNSPFFPHGWMAYTLAVAMHVTMIPLWLAAFSLFTSGLTSGQVRAHVQGSESRIKQHVEERLAAAHHQPAAVLTKLTTLNDTVAALAETVRVTVAARTQHPPPDEPAGNMPADIPARAEKTLRRGAPRPRPADKET